MNIPFVLKFLNKIEVFQVVKKLDKQFDEHILELESEGGVVPLWQVEKKILFWTYKNHKHLGSPLKVDQIRSRKSHLIKELSRDYKREKEIIGSYDIDDVEQNLKANLLRAFGGESMESDDNFKSILEVARKIGVRKGQIGITATEIEKVDIRKVFGNLVSRGYANFYPEVTKTADRYEEKEAQNGVTFYTPIYSDYITTQYNCEGVVISKEGMLIGELLNNLYKLTPEGNLYDDVSRIYHKKTSNKFYLKRRNFFWFYYNCFLWVGYIALFVIIVFILKEFFTIITPIIKIVITDFNLYVDKTKEIFNTFLLSEHCEFFGAHKTIKFFLNILR